MQKNLNLNIIGSSANRGFQSVRENPLASGAGADLRVQLTKRTKKDVTQGGGLS